MGNQTSLAGKCVVVTAGGDGIGLEITRAFAAAGSKVLVCDVQLESLGRLAKSLPDVHSCVADVSRSARAAAAPRSWSECPLWVISGHWQIV
jgi:NAD(P)-dependent dehydrogenase (short-subunit alcohol dehydrogenase family)